MSVSQAAKDQWIASYTQSINDALTKDPALWKEPLRSRVFRTAVKLGAVAAALAGSGPVPAWAAEAATEAVKNDPGCPIGAGSICENA